MHVLGIIEENSRVVSDIPGRINYTKRSIRWNLLKDVLNPSELIRQTYGWGSDQLKFDLLLDRLRQSLNLFDVKAYLVDPSEQLINDYYDPNNPDLPNVQELRIPLIGGTDDQEDPFDFELLLSLIPITPEGNRSAKPIGFALGPSVIGSFQPDDEFSLLDLKLKGGFESDQGIRLEVRPKKVDIRLPSPATGTIDSEVTLATKSTEEPMILIGSELSHRIQVFDVGVRLGIRGQVNNYDATLSLNFAKAEVIIDTSDADGFIKRILGSEAIKVEIKDGSLIWSSKTGLHFGGRAGLELIVPVNRTISSVKLDRLTLGLKASSDNGIDLKVGVTGSAQLGPVLISVENLGTTLSLKPVEEGQPPGVFGDLDLSFDFKPPDGLGIELDTNGVKGGGFIWRSQDQYSGIVEIDLRGFAVQALAVLDTQQPEVSLFFAIFAEFEPPIQLGGGWKIPRIGGLIGFNRTVSLDVIGSGIKSGILDSVLFPDNVIQNAPRIISDFKRFLPPRQGQYLIGPAVRIAYGTPTLIAADIEIILEFPNPFRLAILGKLRSRIPEEATLIQINVGIVGAIDFTNEWAGIYGSLYDSWILFFTLSGDMAMTVSWGEEKNFIFSIGGFNPRFKAPANFPPFGAPPLKRLGVSLSSFVNMECYLAITSNTFQFGARVDAHLDFGVGSLSGFLAFDALFQFSPLYFIVDVKAGISLEVFGIGIGLTFSGTLEGPSPYRLRGSVTFSILFWDVTVHIDARFGRESPQEQIPLIDPWPLLQHDLQLDESWSTDFPEWADLGVTIKESSRADKYLVHPLGSVKVSQRVLPLDHRLTKFGETEPKDNFKFEIDRASSGTSMFSVLSTIEDYFAPAQFSKYNNSQKLSLKSFDLMNAGKTFTLGTSDVSFDILSASHKDMVYETIILKNRERNTETEGLIMVVSITMMQAQIYELVGAAYQTTLQNNKGLQYNLHYQPRAVAVSNEKFVIVDEDLVPVNDNGLKGKFNQASAINKLQEFKKFHPSESRNLQVISAFELQGSAV